MKGKTIVGHSLDDDFKILKVDPKVQNCIIRDIADIKLFMRTHSQESSNDSAGSKNSSDLRSYKRKLKDLAFEFLNASI